MRLPDPANLRIQRQVGQVIELETPRVDPSQAPGMKRGAPDRAGQQGTQPLALMGGQPSGVPGVLRATLCPASRCANIHCTTGAVAGSGSSLCA